MNTKDLLTINQFSQICRTTPRTVRFYEQKKLIVPTYIDPFTKYRYYEKEKLVRQFLRIKLLQNFHMPLSHIKKIVDQGIVETSIDQQLQKGKEEIDEQQKEYAFLQHMKDFLYYRDDLGKLLQTEYVGPFTILARKFPRVEYEKTNLYSQECKKDAQTYGIKTKDEYMMFYETRYYRPKTSYVEIWQICEGKEETKKEIPSNYSFVSFPKTKALTYLYRGPFTYFMLLYKQLNEYIDENKLVKGVHSFDYYLKYQINTPSQYDYLTKICFPIE